MFAVYRYASDGSQNPTQGREEQAAFDKAVDFQILHEMDQATDLPKGAKSVRIGHYSVEMADSGAGDLLTPRRLCGAAYGVLLYAGLLYKGVERS